MFIVIFVITYLKQINTTKGCHLETSIVKSTLVSIFIYLFGSMDKFFITFLVLVLIEYTTSTLNLIMSKSFSLIKITLPFIKYFYYLILIIVAHFLDTTMLSGEEGIRTGLICFYMSIELLIILNNSSAIGIPIPNKLSKVVEILNDDNKKGDT